MIIFPQTVFFEQSPYGDTELEKTKAVWQSHPDLLVCLREKISYDFVKANMIGGNFHKAVLMPDMALYFDEQKGLARSGIMVVLRSDKERVTSDGEKRALLDSLRQYGKPVRSSSMIKPAGIPEKKSEKTVLKKLDEYSRAELVVTDRLHSMIFSAVTGTPCVAMNNSSHKIEGVYEWLKQFDFIKFAQSVKEAEGFCRYLLNGEPRTCDKYDNSPLLPYWERLSCMIKKEKD